jgi:PPP family 3-phenylpropionic acid transporter
VIALHVLVTALGVALGVIYPFISVILADFGFSPGEIGFISSLGAIGFTIAVPAWGHLADVRLGRPRTLQICAIGGGLAMVALLVPVPAALIVVLFLLFWIFESSWQPLADAITVNALRGRDYARVRLWTSLGFSVAAILAGQVYDRTGYSAAFVLLGGAALVMTVAAAALPDVARADLGRHRRAIQAATPGAERADASAATQLSPSPSPPPVPSSPVPSSPSPLSPAPAPTSPAEPPRNAWRRTFSFGSSGVALRVAPKLGLVLLASGLLHVGIISGFTFLPLRIEELGGSPGDIALASGVSAGTEVPAMLVMGMLATRVGLRAIFTLSALLYAACLLSWTVIDVPLVIVATRMVTGIAFSGVVVGVVMTIAVLLPADLQATGQALFQTMAFGVAAVVANVIGGVLYESVGPAALFGTGAALAVAAAVVGWLAFPRAGPRAAVVRPSPA